MQFPAPLSFAADMDDATARRAGGVDRCIVEHDHRSGDVDLAADAALRQVTGIDLAREMNAPRVATFEGDLSSHDRGGRVGGPRALPNRIPERVRGGESYVTEAGIDAAVIFDRVADSIVSTARAAAR